MIVGPMMIGRVDLRRHRCGGGGHRASHVTQVSPAEPLPGESIVRSIMAPQE